MTFKPFYLRGVVVHGKGRGGTQLGFPTANLQLDDQIKEQLKAYENRVVYGWGSVVGLPGNETAGLGPFAFAASVGCNSHFQENILTVEPHFLNQFEEDFYGATVKIVVLGVLREMGVFCSLEALVNAIKEDVRQTRAILDKPEMQRFKDHSLLVPRLLPSDTAPHFELLTLE
ncbi:putative Riboflavin kinase [Trypanosoma vivax]|uniref:riboflavin kinase n=1 Tax=Trypanosoma vivax (strain Y486) TaxID=1055687 RepID=G0U3B7_TRYVY|nr:putative riboflavin kinase [Trypanosoma vivax]KAH8604248.1 putative Riboflavin kinase [Trypanosoma vivax]CCC50773.1 putative riboflavin kinase [Trypanosoma vivax Y486]